MSQSPPLCHFSPFPPVLRSLKSLLFGPENKLQESRIPRLTSCFQDFFFFFFSEVTRTREQNLAASGPGAAPPPLQVSWFLSKTFSNATTCVFTAPRFQCFKRLVSGGEGWPDTSTPRVGGTGKFTCFFHSPRVQLGEERAYRTAPPKKARLPQGPGPGPSTLEEKESWAGAGRR